MADEEVEEMWFDNQVRSLPSELKDVVETIISRLNIMEIDYKEMKVRLKFVESKQCGEQKCPLGLEK